ncbi:endothelial zinc finger protein induced by tumor necrosis factor alpha-like [Epinephelus fuscoguttatus]|uniref:endothelial zinc finger protein induced by tumor necrosis factor alpha-like n=1 Tax=Epinephelus fuscoguttatus TaxID=293821 RepID=UPI0020D0E15F|nr:endothelial zinc finger protein induced by tumor necrosis factor alpha-like [Epinephelus fuscoguttatus]
MSKADVLRGFITDRLTAASQEILAAVDRLVAGYEEEASVLREEISRQRRQLEALQVQVFCIKAGEKCSRGFGPVEEEEEGEDEEEDESTERPQNLDDSTDETPSRCQYKKRKPGRPQVSDTQNHLDLKIRILEDSHTDVLSNSVLKKCPMLKLKCPRGLQETDFLDLLRSTFPQLSGDDRRFDILTSDKRRRLQRLRVKTLTAEEIHRNIGCTGWKSTLYIRLKTQAEPQTSEEEIHPQQTRDDGTEESVSTVAMVTCDDTSPQTSCPVQEVEGGGEGVLSSCSTSQAQDMETEGAEDEDRGISEPVDSKGHGGDYLEKEEEREEANDSDDDWKPDKSNEELKDSELPSTKKEKAKRCGVRTSESETENSDDVLSCRVCGALHKSEVVFVKHAWGHVDDPGGLCGVCGEVSESSEALKDHLQSHHKTDDCHICGESFLGILSLNEHVAAHSGERPHECDVCGDTFALKASLVDHQKLHEAGKLHKCYTCHKVFALKEQLQAHCRTHTNKKTHLCGVCGKSLSDYRSLSRHKMTHSGERPHSCQICGRRFKLPGTLRQHEKIHTDRERSYLCDVCCKMFLTSKQLQIHMRRHTNEKPYRCGECGRGFTTKGPLTIHMRIHTGEAPYRCPDCGWAFKRKTNLDNHVTVHSGLKPFVCGVCGKACARKTYLTVHMRTHNGERPFKCTLCDKAFTQSHCLKTHMKSHLVADAAT